MPLRIPEDVAGAYRAAAGHVLDHRDVPDDPHLHPELRKTDMAPRTAARARHDGLLVTIPAAA